MLVRPLLCVAALTALVAACAPGGGGLVYTSTPEIRSQYSRSELFYALDGRDAETVVVGAPFGGSPQDLAAVVTRAMATAGAQVRANYTTTPGQTARRPYRIVHVFNGTANTIGSTLCGAVSGVEGGVGAAPSPTALPTAPARDRVTLQSAFCHGPNMLTSVDGWVEGVSGPDDPRFVALVQQVTRDLLPPGNPDEAEDRFFRRTSWRLR